MKKSLSITCGLVLILTFMAGAAFSAEQVYKIRFGHVAPPPHPQNLGAVHFKNYVEKFSGGRIQVSIHPVGQLGGEVAMAEAVGLGTQEVASVSAATLTNIVPEMALVSLPFFYATFEEFDRVWTSNVGLAIMRKAENHGMYCMGWGTNGFGSWTNSKRIIHKPEDFQGLKIRSAEAPVYLDSYRAMGVNPITMPWPEVFTSTQQKVIDGLDLPALALEMLKFYETTKYLTVCRWNNSTMMTIINKAFFDRLPKDLQEIVREGLYENGRVNSIRTLEMSLEALNKWEKNGGTVNVLTSEETSAFREKMTPVYDKWKKDIGEDLYKKAVQIIQETRTGK
jgi:tripartite ATP-independent transporter DctP family solute receptor